MKGNDKETTLTHLESAYGYCNTPVSSHPACHIDISGYLLQYKIHNVAKNHLFWGNTDGYRLVKLKEVQKRYKGTSC